MGKHCMQTMPMFFIKSSTSSCFTLVFWHGFGQFSKTWESTPDGREGFQTLFLRDKYAVFLLDQPRRGNAGKSSKPIELKPLMDIKNGLIFSV